jgi:hypothetical protein
MANIKNQILNQTLFTETELLITQKGFIVIEMYLRYKSDLTENDIDGVN